MLGLGVALAAIYALLTGVFAGVDPLPAEEIDERSRAGLVELLREAGGEQ